MNTTVKLCIDCQHFRPESARCMRVEGLSLVYGTLQLRNSRAASERTYDASGCGTQAKYFEAKEEDYDSVDPINFGAEEYKKKHDCVRSGCTVCVAFEH